MSMAALPCYSHALRWMAQPLEGLLLVSQQELETIAFLCISLCYLPRLEAHLQEVPRFITC